MDHTHAPTPDRRPESVTPAPAPATGGALAGTLPVPLPRCSGLTTGAVARRTPDAAGELGVIRRVMINGVDCRGVANAGDEPDARTLNNATIIKRSLQVIVDAQNQDESDNETWTGWAREICDRLGVRVGDKLDPALSAEIGAFYAEIEELSFLSNPFLSQAWQACLDSTRAAASASQYGVVGPKFAKKALELLDGIKEDYRHHADIVALSDEVIRWIPGFNKEHQINKSKVHGGAQVDKYNLQGGATPTTPGGSSISLFHRYLHSLKSGSGTLDYTKLDPEIKEIIARAQEKYRPNFMGDLIP